MSEERREHYRLVARIAKRRSTLMDSLDLATKYEEGPALATSPGSLL